MKTPELLHRVHTECSSRLKQSSAVLGIEPLTAHKAPPDGGPP